ncbi:MAG: Trm112 family protein [Chloroflexota bacterium]|nr:Trm112 family protein [Chloroflexota bacterium]
MSQTTNNKPLGEELLALLICPKCMTSQRVSKVELSEDNTSLICQNAECKREYQIKDGIPVMLVED